MTMQDEYAKAMIDLLREILRVLEEIRFDLQKG